VTVKTRHLSTAPPALTAVFSADFLGGSELFNLEYLREAHASGVAIDAIVPAEGPLSDALQRICRSVVVVAIPLSLRELSRFENRLSPSRCVSRIGHVLSHRRRLRAAILHAQGPICCFGFRAQLAVGTQRQIRDRPLVWVIHEVVPAGPFGRLWGLLSRRTRLLLAYSRTAGEQPLLPRSKARIVAPSLDLEAYEQVQPPRRPPARLILVGDLFPIKNHEGFFTVIQQLHTRGCLIDGLIVGRRNDSRPELSAYGDRIHAQASAPDSHVTLTQCGPDEMPDTLGSADLLIHLTVVPESFGRVCAEAMATGRPVVGFDHGGVAEIVEHGVTGLLSPPGNLEAIVANVERIVADRALFERLSAESARIAPERYGSHQRRETIGKALVTVARGESADA
jgi:glycosyltransferase involved in cell wall biosynthesis